VAEGVELWEEVSWVRATAIMVGAQAERMAQERAVLLAFAQGVVNEVAQKVSQLPSLVDNVADAIR
jgi:hypothetical protein